MSAMSRELIAFHICIGVMFHLLVTCNTTLAALKDYRSLQRNVSYLLDDLLNGSRYDKRIRPDFGGPPVTITVNMLIKSMGPVSETGEEYVMDCYFRQTWQDTRLTFDFPGMDEFSLPWLFLDRVWKPDTFFMNGKKSHLHRITVPNKFLRLKYDGALTYSMRLTIKASCPMHLRKFPLDSQTCPLLIGSYGYLSSDVLYKWNDGNAVVEEGVELAQYDLVNISTEPTQLVLRGKDEYSMIKVSFMMKRHTGYFMLQVFAPCCLIVCCSWVSFWIDPDAVPARVSLGVTTVLSMTTMGFGGRAQMPKVSYATALDWFVILCFSFVFAVMVEYAFINFIDKITGDIKRILEEKGIKKPRKPDPKPLADGALPTGTGPSPEPVVPMLVVDLAPTPSPTPDPVYAEVCDATHPEVGAGAPAAEAARVLGRTPVLRTANAMEDGQQVLMASMVLEEAEPPPESPPENKKDKQGGRRRRHSLFVPRPLLRRRSLADLPSGDVERGPAPPPRRASVMEGGGAGGAPGRRRTSRRDSNLLTPPAPLDEGDDEDAYDEDFEDDDDDDDSPPLDTLEALEVSIRGSMMELREVLGEATETAGRSLRHYLQRPCAALRDLRVLPNEQDVTKLIMSDDPPPKFSKIDIAARRYFPLLFFLLLSLYIYLYSYYISDEFPAKVLRTDMNMNVRRLQGL